MKKNQFLRTYFNDFLDKVVPDENMLESLVAITDLLIEVNQNGNKFNAMTIKNICSQRVR